MMVRQLPKARRIVDLGGGAHVDEGALVYMGYPYPFELLTIVEPPREARHASYAGVAPGTLSAVGSRLGPVTYLYQSMASFPSIPDGSVDMVFSGESIEHVTREECEEVFAEARRVLKPDGWFCFDTPNSLVTHIQCPERYLNPDHKYEYSCEEMRDLIRRHGFEITEAKGITLMRETVRSGIFQVGEMVTNVGLYDDIEACYLQYYRCRPR